MTNTVSIPVQLAHSLRAECGQAAEVCVEAASVREALTRLSERYPALYRCVCDETGAVRRHLHLFVNNTLLHRQKGLDTVLAPGDVLSIMTAVSGG